MGVRGWLPEQKLGWAKYLLSEHRIMVMEVAFAMAENGGIVLPFEPLYLLLPRISTPSN